MAQARYALGDCSAACVQKMSLRRGVLKNKVGEVISEPLVCRPYSLVKTEVVRWGGDAQVRSLTPETHTQDQAWRRENSLH